ncbi:MAG: DUF4345 family protein [Planctomycetaceae bacterium]
MVGRLFLAATGILYLYLALWCSFQPQATSSLVGFQLQGGSGQSEFLTVYGGLEFGLGLVLIWPIVRPQVTREILWCCFVIHASLVVFRTIGFVLYSDIRTTTWKLAAGEWVILIASAALLLLSVPRKTNTAAP